MSETKVVGLVYEYLNNLSTLPPAYDFKNSVGKVIFHSDPKAELLRGALVSNVDAFLDFRFKGDPTAKQIFGSTYYRYSKPSKMTQHFKILKFNETRSGYTLSTPRQFVSWSTGLSANAHPLSDFGILDCTSVVIKPQYGARGSNHVVAPSHMVQTLLKTITKQTGNELKQMYPDIIVSRGSVEDEPIFETLNDMVITEKLEHVLKEWRLLFSAGRVYCREREITPGDYSQSNLCADVYRNIPEVIYTPLEDTDFPNELQEYLTAFVRFIKLPFGSIDLYLTANGEYGIFEYSEQFGFHGANHEFIRQLHLDGIEQILIKLFLATEPLAIKEEVKRDISSWDVSNVTNKINHNHLNGPFFNAVFKEK